MGSIANFGVCLSHGSGKIKSDRLRDDRNIVLRAIKTYGGVLEDASDRLQKDDELIRIAEKNS